MSGTVHVGGRRNVTAAHITSGNAFPSDRKSDRNFFLLYVVLIWAGFFAGFVPEMIQHVREHRPFPLIVHIHAVAFVGWLVLLTTQVLFIRRAQYDLHRRLGLFGVGLAVVMIVLGPVTAIYMQRLNFGTAESEPAFLAVQLTDILAFAGLVAAAIAYRGTPPAHKRLMLLATLYISDAIYARVFGDTLHPLMGDGFWPFLIEAYLVNDILMFGMGVYDLITRRQLHPAYVWGVAWTLANQLLGSFLYHSAFWKPIALNLIGH
jgi:hypothetical protein